LIAFYVVSDVRTTDAIEHLVAGCSNWRTVQRETRGQHFIPIPTIHPQNKLFSSYMRRYLENVTRYDQSYY